MDKITQDKDTGTIAICAVRYALGRQTYMPDIVQKWVMRHPEIVDASVKEVMLRDISDADHINEYKREDVSVLRLDGLGDTRIDRPGWLKFKAWLEAL